MFLKEQYGVSIHTCMQPHTLPTQGRGGKSSPHSVSIQDPTLPSVPNLASIKNLGNHPQDVPHAETPSAL